MAESQQFCTFTVGSLFLGIEVLQVQEVLRAQQMTPVPLASRAVTGLINLRGQIVTAIDLRRRLGLPDRPAGTDAMNVVVRTHDGAVSLVVDEIGDVVEVTPETFELPPETLPADARGLIRGVFKLPGGLLLALDTRQALELE
jgi:purine-binding chemotaxis protein CheW